MRHAPFNIEPQAMVLFFQVLDRQLHKYARNGRIPDYPHDRGYLPVLGPKWSSVVDNLANALTTLKTNVDAFVSNGDVAELNAASAPIASAPSSDSAFYHGLATRIFLALTFGIFAGYAGRQASHFMEIEKKNRKLALELEALGPFIEPLKQEDRDKFRVQVGDRSFGVPDHDIRSKMEDDPVTALAIMKSKEIQEFVTNLVKETVKAVKP